MVSKFRPRNLIQHGIYCQPRSPPYRLVPRYGRIYSRYFGIHGSSISVSKTNSNIRHLSRTRTRRTSACMEDKNLIRRNSNRAFEEREHWASSPVVCYSMVWNNCRTLSSTCAPTSCQRQLVIHNPEIGLIIHDNAFSKAALQECCVDKFLETLMLSSCAHLPSILQLLFRC